MKRLAPTLALTLALVTALCLVVSGRKPAEAQANLTIHVTAPTNGATVSNPVTVSVQSSGIPIKPATDNDPNAAHYHYFVDRNPATVLQQGQPIPTGQPDIIHTDSANQQMPTLSPGQHTVWVVLAHTDHTPFNPNVQDQVSFTVGAPGQPAAAASPAAAGAPPAAGASQAAGAPRPPIVGRGGLLPAAEQSGDAVPSLTRVATENPWLPVLGLVILAGALLGGGLYRIRRFGSRS